MELTSPTSPATTARKRNDLRTRPVPEINLCMVYRPKPARIFTLTLSAWLLMEMCDGSAVHDILARYQDTLGRKGKATTAAEANAGLRSLIESELIIVSPAA